MCALRGFDKKTRTIYSIGNVFLIAGLSIPLFFNGGRVHHRMLDGVGGACLLVAIVLLLWVLRHRRRNSLEPEAGRA